MNDRLALMIEQRAEGWTLKRVGEFHGVSGERVRQILVRWETRRLIAEIRDTQSLSV